MHPAEPVAPQRSLARLLAGGRHNRLLILGTPPPGLVVGDTGHFERTARLVCPGHSAAAGQVVAHPEQLPFIEALFDRLLVTTVLPAATARAELRELWRIMSPAALMLLVIKARRPWQFAGPGWLEEALKPVIEAAPFMPLDWQVETVPDRQHLVLVAKRDGLRPAPIGRVATHAVAATA